MSIVKIVAAWAAALWLSACGPLIAEYSVEAYKNATTLKAEAQALVDKSSASYTSSKREIDAFTTKLNVAYEFAAGMAYNQIAAQQWQILRSPDGPLYGAFLRAWKAQGTLGPGFRREFKAQMDEAFDYIICLEANKQAARPCATARSDAQRPTGLAGLAAVLLPR